MKKSWIIFASLLGLLAACAAPTATPVPTPYPPEYLPTVIALTANAANIAATETASASAPTAEPTNTPEPTITPSPAPTFTATTIPGHNLGAIRFVSPGPMSKVISPIQLNLYVIAGASQRVQIDLYGEDGRLLGRQLHNNVLLTTEGAILFIKMPFEIRAAAEVGRITVSTLDKEGRIQSLNSLRLLLLSSGVNEITTPGNPSEPAAIFSPVEGATISGGVVRFKGDVWPFSLQPVVLELVDVTGRSLGLRIINLDQTNPQLIETTIPYKVTESTEARLVVRQDDDRMPGVFYVYTQEIFLSP
jgi:hypothetical protein